MLQLHRHSSAVPFQRSGQRERDIYITDLDTAALSAIAGLHNDESCHSIEFGASSVEHRGVGLDRHLRRGHPWVPRPEAAKRGTVSGGRQSS